MYSATYENLFTMQKKKGKTNAQRQKEYRQRKKEEKERLNPKKKPKTDAERQRECRQRKRLEMKSLIPKRKPKTNAERQKQFRLKQKMLLQSEQLDSNVARHSPDVKQRKSSKEYQKAYRENLKKIKQNLSIEEKPKKTHSQRQREYSQRIKNKIDEILKIKALREEMKSCQLDVILQKEENYSQTREKEEVRIKQENTEDSSSVKDNTEYPILEDVKEEIITIKCEVFEEPLQVLRKKEMKSCQLDAILQKEENYSQIREKEEVRIKQENTEDSSSVKDNTEYPIIEDVKEEKITIKCEVFEEPLHPSGSGNDVTSATAQIQVKLEPQDELPVENSLYLEVPPVFRPGSADKFVPSATEQVVVKVEYEEDGEAKVEPSQMEFP